MRFPEDSGKIIAFIMTAYRTQISVHIYNQSQNKTCNDIAKWPLIVRLVNTETCITFENVYSTFMS